MRLASRSASRTRPLLVAAVAVLFTIGLAPPAQAAGETGAQADAQAGGEVGARAGGGLAFRDPRRPMAARVDDLLGRLTLDEKISLLHQYQPAIPRLGIGLFKTGTEALHGVAWSCDYHNGGAVVTATATAFPQAIGLASTWDTDLMRRVGAAVGDEARGLHAGNPDVWGLNLWAPVVNLLRDPRWGRNEEGYSEDPYLTGAIATAYGRGLQGDDPTYLKTAPTLKHYLAYNNEAHRDTSSSTVPQRVLHDYDQQAFRIPLTAGAATGVMPSYNLVNGRPTTVSTDLDAIRSWSRTPLFNPSDAGAPANLVGSQRYHPTQAQANAAAIKAGVNSFTQDDTNPASTVTAIKAALDQGLLTQADLDDAVRQNLTLRFRLGEFDPDGGPYGSIPASTVDSPQHRQLARRAADESMVLLRNTGVLPLRAEATRRVAVLGPLSDVLYRDWYGGNPPYQVTPRQGIADRLGAAGTVIGAEGLDRIALRSTATGKYLVGGAGTAGAPLAATGGTADATAQFDVADWGQGVLTLRNVANGRYVGYNWSTFVNDQTQPNGWFVQQQFKLEPRADGGVALRYAGYESASDWSTAYRTPYLVAQADGTMVLGAATAAEATGFSKETIRSGVDEAVAAATGADAAVVVVGSMPFINGREDHDRTSLALAEGQSALIRAVRAANPNTVVVVENSYPTTLNWEQDNIGGLVWTSHAGQETGRALAGVLFGDVNPAGRLTQTWYRGEADLPDIGDYDIVGARRTYQYFQGTPLYPMGYGLSYTTFRYGPLRVSSPELTAGGTVRVAVDVTNTGGRAGDEVVQLYTHQRTSRVEQPVKQLRAFQRVHLRPGQTRRVTFPLAAADLAFWDVTTQRPVVETSAQDLMVGSSSTDIRARGQVVVRGQTIAPRNLAAETRGEAFDGYHNVTLLDETVTAGTVAAATGAPGWLRYADAQLTGARSFTARVSNAAAATAIQIRLDDPDTGPLLGTAVVPATGDPYGYTTVTADLAGATGRHDVYLTVDGRTRLATFAIR